MTGKYPGLTQRQQEMLDYMVDFTKANNYPPSLAEIGSAFGMTKQGPRCHLAKMALKRYVIKIQTGSSTWIYFPNTGKCSLCGSLKRR